MYSRTSTTEPMAIHDTMFSSKDQRWGVLRFSRSKTKIKGFTILRIAERSWTVLRSSVTTNVDDRFDDIPPSKIPEYVLHEKRRYPGPTRGTKSGRRPSKITVPHRELSAFQTVTVFLRRLTWKLYLFVLSNRYYKQLSTMPRRAQETVVFWANRPVGVPFYSAPPRHSTVRRLAAIRPWCVRAWPSKGRRWRYPRLSICCYVSHSNTNRESLVSKYGCATSSSFHTGFHIARFFAK